MCEYVCVGGGGGREGLHHLHRAQAQEVIPANQPPTWRSQAGRGGRCGTLPTRPCPPRSRHPLLPSPLSALPVLTVSSPLYAPRRNHQAAGAALLPAPAAEAGEEAEEQAQGRAPPQTASPPLPVYTLSLGTSRDSYGLGLWDQVIRFQRSVSAPDTSQIKPVAPFTSLTPSTSTPPLPACSPRTPRQ